MLWNTQQNELFDDIDKQCQEVVDAVTPAIARMELTACRSMLLHIERRSRAGRMNWLSPRTRYITHRLCAIYESRRIAGAPT